MGHRSLIAYAQMNGTFNIHYSHWGAHNLKLCEKITETTPLGGENDMEPKYLGELASALTGMADENDMEVSGAMVEKQDTRNINPEPDKHSVQFEELLDYCIEAGDIEAIYVVEQDFTTHGYVYENVSFAEEQDGAFFYKPSFMSTGEPQNIGNLQGMISGMRTQLKALVDDDVLSADEAHTRFKDKLYDRFERGMGMHILAQSPIVNEDDFSTRQKAFIETTGSSRILSEMVPHRYKDIEPWQVPDGFDLNPTTSQIESVVEELLEDTGTQTGTTTQDDSSVTENKTLTDFSSTTSVEDEQQSPHTSLTEAYSLSNIDVDDLPPVELEPTGHGRRDIQVKIGENLYSGFCMPNNLREEFHSYREATRGFSRNLTKVHECTACRDRDNGIPHGYLTTSDNVGAFKGTYTCPNSWREEWLTSTKIGHREAENWELSATVNGVDRRIIDDESSDEPREYVFTIEKRAEPDFESDVIGSSEVSVTEPDEDIPRSYTEGELPTKTIEGETNGKSWVLEITFAPETVKCEWTRVNDDGEPVEYVYEETDDRGASAYNVIGTTNSGTSDVDVNEDEYEGPIHTETLDMECQSYASNRDCESTDFDQVWPNSPLSKNELNPHHISPDDVPNSVSHLSRITNQVENIPEEETLKQTFGLLALLIEQQY